VEWFTPLSAPGVTPVVSWWRVSDSSLVESKSFTAVAGTRQQILFDAPVPITAGEYRVSVHTIFFTLTSSWGGWPASSDSMITDNPDGWLSVGPGFPGTGPTASLYHVSPIFEPGGVDPPAEGSAALGLDLAVDATGARDSEGTTALGLDLAVAASGSSPNGGSVDLGLDLAVAASGSSSNGGSVALALDLAVAASGATPGAGGSVALGLNLAMAASGLRDSLGTSALGLNFSVSATGSNGDAGCPVLPFPFGPSLISGYPWSARAVKSFPGEDCT
jgi:hypothetical protein